MANGVEEGSTEFRVQGLFGSKVGFPWDKLFNDKNNIGATRVEEGQLKKIVYWVKKKTHIYNLCDCCYTLRKHLRYNILICVYYKSINKDDIYNQRPWEIDS